jgi:hypothetical protein
MRCQRAQQRLMAYHDGELSPGAARRVEKHLELCTECGPLLERLRLADHHAGSKVDLNGVAGVPGMVPPDERYWESFTARVLDRVEEDAATRAPATHKPRRSWNFTIPRMAPAFSIALVVVVAAGVLIKTGDPVPVPKATVTQMKSATEEDVTAGDGEVSRARPEPVVGFSKEEPSPYSVEKTGENGDNLRSTPEPEPAMKKREASAAPGVGAETEGAGIDIAPGPATQEPFSKETKAQDPLPSVPAAVDVDGNLVTIEEVSKVAPEVPVESKLDQANIPQIESETSQAEEKPLDVPSDMDADLNASVGKDDQVHEEAAILKTAPAVQADTADTMMDEDGSVTLSPPAAAALRENPSEEAEALVQTSEEPDEQKVEVALTAPGEVKDTMSGVKAQDSSVSPGETRNAFVSRQPYRGPEDQLLHARNLADVRKFWESEQVLKDLLSQRPPSPLQAEASILLVKVLSSQNRIGEAQQVLDDARVQFPASEMIQTFDLKSEGVKP